MDEIELQPTLEHCIETTARKRYEEIATALLNGRILSAKAVEELELLHTFLTTADFPALRAASERELLQGKKVVFRLQLEEADVKCGMETF